ncbi:MAG: hypothetical protein DHS20C18_06280 [Saprospiraceae bacterium]|nr:MAG: hypothetical protein DHS20C18_06280 [Saprospiraceae bacterium]
MQTYIALLRGINVSGQKKIKMAELKSHLETLDFEDVQTYIQSGNIVFKAAAKSSKALGQLIEKKLQDKYSFHVPTLVKTPEELDYVLLNNPFLEDPEKETKRMYVTFLGEEPSPDRIELLKTVDYSPEAYHLDGKNIFFYSPNGYGRAKMNNNFFENKLKVAATTRNWNTVNKLFEMSGGER